MAEDYVGPTGHKESNGSHPGSSHIAVRNDTRGKLLTRAEAARALGVHPKTLDRWVESGRVGSLCRGAASLPTQRPRGGCAGCS
ncbi:MAG: type IV toxin-antitoxin system AbiEi family antitoxin domain-containing protein [Thermoleophilaceae bacterium]